MIGIRRSGDSARRGVKRDIGFVKPATSRRECRVDWGCQGTESHTPEVDRKYRDMSNIVFHFRCSILCIQCDFHPSRRVPPPSLRRLW